MSGKQSKKKKIQSRPVARARARDEALGDILAILPEDAKTILEIGRGDAFITEALPKNLKVKALDVSPKALARVKRPALQGPITDLPFPDASWDLVLCRGVLERLSERDRLRAVAEMSRAAAKYVVVATPLWEDLNLDLIQCEACGSLYQGSGHKKSFSPEGCRQLFNDASWLCLLQVLSGDASLQTPPEASFFKSVLLRHNTTSLWPTWCEHCGRPFRPADPDHPDEGRVEQWNYFLAGRQNRTGVAPRILRTECLSLFGKNRKSPRLLPAGFYDAGFNPVETALKAYPQGEILFEEEKIFRAAHLRPSFPRPQYVNVRPAAGRGAEIAPGDNALFSFFLPGDLRGETLTISGTAEKKGAACISYYFSSLFTPIHNMEYRAGDFELVVGLPPIPLSQYGFLFSLTASTGLRLKKASLSQNRGEFKVSLTGQARFWRLPGPHPVLLSLPVYEGFLPHQPWMGNLSEAAEEIERYSLAEGDPAAREKTILAAQKSAVDFFLQGTALSEARFKELENRQTELQNDMNRVLRLLPVRRLQKIRSWPGKIQRLSGKIQRLPGKIKWRLSRWPEKIKNKADRLRLKTPWKENIMFLADSPKLHQRWEKPIPGRRPRFLMICHDQDMDRRVIQEAASLLDDGWEGLVVALSYDNNDALEEVDGVMIHRIGLSRIVPDCAVYWAWRKRGEICAELAFADFWHRLNDRLYHYSLKRRYRGTNVHHPLPFDRAFYGAARHYRADVVQAHDLPALKTAVRLGGEWNVPVVYDAHEFYPEQIAFSQKQKQIMFDAEGENINKCAAVFTVNQSIAEAMAGKYGCGRPPRVLINALDPPPDLNPASGLLRKHFRFAGRDKIFLMQGGLSPNRNFEVLVKAMAEVKNQNIRLVFMGDGPEKQKLRSLAEDLKAPVFFKDATPQKEVLQWACTADVGLIPYPAVDLNTKFCTPNKLFEYIQAGLPIVANDLPELRRFVHDAGFGRVVDMEDPRVVAAAFDEVAGDPEQLARIRRTLQERKSEYAWKNVVGEYVSTMNALALNKRGNQAEPKQEVKGAGRRPGADLGRSSVLH
ncbi:MAG: glycosyltransferase [Candidatus Adiutrix sp.]|nr:glycosyltransferase [Candidatus Adiutrix sp.]